MELEKELFDEPHQLDDPTWGLLLVELQPQGQPTVDGPLEMLPRADDQIPKV